MKPGTINLGLKMKLKQLLKGIENVEVKGSKEVEILGLCNNSKLAAPGFLFFAKKGLKHHGNRFISEVKAAGAVAVVTDLFDPFLEGMVQVIYSDVSALESKIAEVFYGSASKKLLTIGITGTNGKTTSSYLIRHLFEEMGLSTGLIGTIQWIVKDSIFPASFTTPDVITNHKLLHEMVTSRCKAVVMEVSSHALDQRRVAGIDFDIALFTNMTEEHLDYHGNMEEYGKAKSKLFSSLERSNNSFKSYPKCSVINIDSPWAQKMIDQTKVSVLTFGLSEKAQVRAEKIILTPEGSRCRIVTKDQSLDFQTPLIGKFNIYNCLGAIAVSIALGFDLKKSLEILSSFNAVPGRLERVQNIRGKNIFVDYAHTEDALKNVLETLREIGKGKIFCVFGCGGNRDQQKRPKMGAVAEELADQVFVTTDNPRGENPEAIIQEILSGIKDLKKVSVETDRRKAIERAIYQMNQDDLLLIAGKGHENYQIFSHQTIHFDDRIIAKEYCR